MCPNHVQCDIVPTALTSEVVLPGYQHYLEREHHTKGSRVNESETLNQYGKTILMLILARVNRLLFTLFSTVHNRGGTKMLSMEMSFLMLRMKFFKHRLQTKFPKISKESAETALVFLEKQKIPNCSCLIHTESRGYNWVVFRRQLDRTPTLYYDVEQTDSEEEDEQDDDYYQYGTCGL